MNPVNYKFYSTGDGVAVLPGANVGPTFREISFDEFKKTAQSKLQGGSYQYINGVQTLVGASGNYYDKLKFGTDKGVADAILAAEQGGAPVKAGELINGNFTTNKSLEQEAGFQQGVKEGKLKEVDMGNGIKGYVPAPGVSNGVTTGQAPYVPPSTGDPGAITQALQGSPQATGGSTANVNLGGVSNSGGGQVAGVMSSPQSYIVKPGDTLSKIAKQFGVLPSQISGYRSGNPNKIFPGEQLTIGTPSSNSQTAISPAPQQSVTAQTGQIVPPTPTGKTPVQNMVDTYKEVASALGLFTVKQQLEKTLKELDDIQASKSKEAADITNNPWLSQDIRNRELKKLDDKYEGKLNRHANMAKYYEALYDQGIEEARYLVGEIQTDNRKALEIAQRQAEAEADLMKEMLKQSQPEYEFRVLQDADGNDYLVTLDKKTGRRVSGGVGGGTSGGVTGGVIGGTTGGGTSGVSGTQKYTVKGKPLSAEASKVNAIVQTLVPEIEQLKIAFNKDYKGSVRGIVLKTDRNLVKLVDQVADKVGRLRSGGAVNKDEEARFKRQIASVLDLTFGTKEGAITALNGLISEAEAVAGGIGTGIQTTPVFNSSQFKAPSGKTYNLPF